MAEATWQKTADSIELSHTFTTNKKRYAYLIIGLALIGVVAFLFINGMATGNYYMTVDELMADSTKIGKDVRVAGAVDGSTIVFNPETQVLSFTVANIPNDSTTIREAGGLGQILYQALEDPNSTRMEIQWEYAEMPDLLQHEAQAIMTGYMGEDGVFHANQVLLKCPTRYSDDIPQQAS